MSARPLIEIEFLDGEAAEFPGFPAEGFADWLTVACSGAGDVLLPPRMDTVTAADLGAQSPAALVGLTFDGGQPAQTRIAAIEALRAAFDAARAADEARMLADLRCPERRAALDAVMGDVIQQFNALKVRK